jgi:nitrite reductase/ring-hydroxylating ferredoxin subunit
MANRGTRRELTGSGKGIDVGDVHVLQPRQMKLVDVGRRSALLIRTAAGDYFALSNLCAHQGVDLSAGILTGHWLAGEVGEYTFIDDAEVLRCPRHGYEYDVRSGRSWFDPASVRIRSYDVRVEDGRLIVEVPGG